MKLGTQIKLRTTVRDNFGKSHGFGEQARVVGIAKETIQIEFPDPCIYKRGRALVKIVSVEEL